MSILDGLSPLGPIIDIVGKAIDKIIPDTNERAKAKEEITRQLIENQASLYDAMKTVMAADASSESWMTRNARPTVVFWCLGMMTWVVISPVFGLQTSTIQAVSAIPESLWSLAAYGIGAYIIGKSGEVIVKAIKGK